jgi:hypothetical protein
MLTIPCGLIDADSIGVTGDLPPDPARSGQLRR